jgi:hypothetical protein
MNHAGESRASCPAVVAMSRHSTTRCAISCAQIGVGFQLFMMEPTVNHGATLRHPVPEPELRWPTFSPWFGDSPRSEPVAAMKVASCSWSLTCVINHPLYTEPLPTLSQDATLHFGHMPHSASLPPPLLAHVHMPMNQRMFWIEAKSGETKRGCRMVNTRGQILRVCETKAREEQVEPAS